MLTQPLQSTNKQTVITTPATPHISDMYCITPRHKLVQTPPVDSAITVTAASVNLDCSVDLAHKEVRSVEADRTRQQPEREDHQRRVAKVQKRRNELRDFQLNTEHTANMLTDRPISTVKAQLIIWDILKTHKVQWLFPD